MINTPYGTTYVRGKQMKSQKIEKIVRSQAALSFGDSMTNFFAFRSVIICKNPVPIIQTDAPDMTRISFGPLESMNSENQPSARIATK